jgi:mutual gliding-motility protein MglA
MFINWKLREISLKIVYYGPALSGKTSNLQWIHAKTSPTIRGDLVSLNTRGDRTIYFDFLQIELGQIGGLKPRFNLYTVPGQVYYSGSRRLVLQGVDGVVFVADSQAHRLPANVETRHDMKENLTALGLDPFGMPIVLQCNKRDIPNAAATSVIKQQLGFDNVPCIESIALQGTGVFETLKAIINLVVAQAQQKL